MTPVDPKLSLFHHVAYEVGMLRELETLLRKSGVSDATNWRRNVTDLALLEAFILHARVLFEFLFFPPSGNYIRAASYIREGITWPPMMGFALLRLREHANTDAVHLSKSRIRGDDWRWNYLDMRESLDSAFNAFVESLKPEHKSELIEEFDRLRIPLNSVPQSPNAD